MRHEVMKITKKRMERENPMILVTYRLDYNEGEDGEFAALSLKIRKLSSFDMDHTVA